MRIALIIPNPSFLIEPRTFPMLGPLYLSSVLKKAGHEVQVLDLTGTNEIPDMPEADIYGITSTTPMFSEAVRIKNEIRKKYHNAFVAIGGPHAMVDAGSCFGFDNGFNWVCRGEGEEAILSLAENFSLYNNKQMTTVVTPDTIKDLDSMPFPDREAIDLKSYHYYLDDKLTTNIITARGCPFAGKCAFCCNVWGNKVRYRSWENVLNEVRQLKDMGYRGVMLYDDEFFINEMRDAFIVGGLGALGMVWRCFSRADLILKREWLIKEAAKNGLKEMLIGCESGSDRILKNINKGTTRQMNLDAIKLLHENGIRVKAALIVGLPGEDEISIAETECFCDEAQADDYDFTVCTVYPGSPIYEHPENYDIRFSNEFHPYKGKPGEYHSGVSTSGLSADKIVKFRDVLEQEFKRWK